MCVCVQTERCWEGRGDVLNPGSQSPNKHSQKLVLTHAECPSTSWVKNPKTSLEDNYLKTHSLIFFAGWSTSNAVCTVILVATPTVCSLPPSLPEFMEGTVQFPLFRTLCQLTRGYQWKPFVKMGCGSIGLALFHELLIYPDFVSCCRESFHLLNFEIPGFITTPTSSV